MTGAHVEAVGDRDVMEETTNLKEKRLFEEQIRKESLIQNIFSSTLYETSKDGIPFPF